MNDAEKVREALDSFAPFVGPGDNVYELVNDAYPALDSILTELDDALREKGEQRAARHQAEERAEKAEVERGQFALEIQRQDTRIQELEAALSNIFRGEEEAPVGMSNPAAIARQALAEDDA